MSQARIRDAVLPPAMDGRDRRLDHRGNCGGAPKGIDDGISVRHTAVNAIIVTDGQAQYCDIRDCDIRSKRLFSRVPSEPPPPLSELAPEVAAIFERLDELGFGQKTLADWMGLAPNKISLIRRLKRRMTLEEVARARELLKMDEPPEDEPEAVREIPVIGMVVAGKWREEVESTRRAIPCPDPTLPKGVFGVEVSGDSMDLIAGPGTIIMVDPSDRQLFKGRYFVIKNGEGEMTFKRYMEDPARLAPCSTNQAHLPVLLGDHPIEVVGRVLMTANWLR